MTWLLSLRPLVQLGLLYLLILNAVTFFFFGWDKWRSQLATARRVRERTLWALALLGGSVGALVGMSMFRHKTRKHSFQAVIAIILVLHILLILSQAR